ncbi:DUF484 domain-containing protein [Idiomarina tyrosinivorans]|uniref:DUF484 domain-containing protein n=1 Tax=Idiomarina tyrosinivorans TaxID=1445662 RepID=A0A432ZPR1_9GAMM|nr:DUF484 family protein [Idiomarina tyrosinivorans]RUO79884.1 DUF484 domain-containing protein [Idiomarina tyrosinivorans]
MKNDSSSLPGNAQIDDSFIREYLQENPDFFIRNDDLLDQLTLQHQQKGAVSLIERQQQKLRERVRTLEEEITSLMAEGARNDALFKSYSDLYVRLLKSASLEQALAELRKTFAEELGMPALTLKFFDSPLENNVQVAIISDAQRELIADRLHEQSVYLGRLTAREQHLLFPEENIGSVALLLLGDEGEMGLLAIGSHDSHHFDPSMDALLITQLQALLGALLPSLLDHDHA